MAERHRGLPIVDALSATWGWTDDLRITGKSAWARPSLPGAWTRRLQDLPYWLRELRRRRHTSGRTGWDGGIWRVAATARREDRAPEKPKSRAIARGSDLARR
ncbi:hypothetical protein ACWDZ8_37550 [Streptomyces sp. NPDC003233]